MGRRGILRALRPRAHVADDLQHPLAASAVGLGVGLRRLLRVHDDLDDAAAVAEVEEDQAAVVAAAVDPPGERHPPSDVLPAQRAAVDVLVHGCLQDV